VKYFGERGWLEDRIQLLKEKERKGIEEFVRRKLEEREKRILHHGNMEEPEEVESRMTCS
jgi:hypothetical protein